MRAARYIGVAPWELEQQSTKWRDRALIAENAENWAIKERRRFKMDD